MLCTVVLFAGTPLSVMAQSETTSILHLSQTIELPGVKGEFDHFGYDGERQRLFLAAEDNGTIEMIDLKQGRRIQSLPGFKSPHSILVRRGSTNMLVTDSGPDASALVNVSSFENMRRLNLALGANCILFDGRRSRLYVTGGGDRVGQKTSTLQAVDPNTGKVLRSVDVNALHLQPMALDEGTGRLFVNLADQEAIGIFDSDSLARTATWKIPQGHNNSPIAFDSAHGRLFVISREPGILLQLNADHGALDASIATPADPDDMDYDPKTQRIFVPGDG